jgi:hypothetical protein
MQINKISNFIILSFFATIIIGAIFGFSAAFYISISISIAGHILILKYFTSKKVIIAYLIIMFYLLLSMVSYVVNENAELGSLFASTIYSSIAILLILTKLNIKYVFILFFLIMLILLYRIFTIDDLNNIFKDSSRNYVSVYIIFLLFLYFISVFQNKLSLNLFIIFSFVAFSFWSLGRSGIAVSLLLLLLTIFFKIRIDSRRNKQYTIAILSIFVVLTILYFPDIKNLVSRFFDESTSTFGGRSTIWVEYLNASSKTIINLIFGPNVDSNLGWLSINNNLHNSFINLYSRTGMIGLFYVLYLISLSLFRMIKKKYYILLIISLIFLIRSFFDLIFAYFYGDVFMYYLMLFYIFESNIFPISKKITGKTQSKQNLNGVGDNHEY